MLKLRTTPRKLKVTLVIDAAPLMALQAISDGAPARTEITVAVGGRIEEAGLVAQVKVAAEPAAA